LLRARRRSQVAQRSSARGPGGPLGDLERSAERALRDLSGQARRLLERG
jgi:hypothetical protein